MRNFIQQQSIFTWHAMPVFTCARTITKAMTKIITSDITHGIEMHTKRVKLIT